MQKVSNTICHSYIRVRAESPGVRFDSVSEKLYMSVVVLVGAGGDENLSEV